MDEGAAAIWAAGIGVGGVVVTAAAGWFSSIRTGRAQVDAALAGVNAQAEVQRQEAVWQARRDAYASFLGQIEVMKRAIAHMQATAGMYEEGLGRSGADLTAAKEAMARTFEVLWFRESALRLSVDTDEADRAEALMVLARRAMEHAEDFADAAWSAQRGPYEPGRRLDAAMRELHGGVLEWTRTARRNLEGGAQATD